MTTGMSRITGAPLSGDEHIAQSVGDILSTPIGTRTMREDYGSLLFDLADLPMNAATRQLIVAASVMAIQRWETRIKVKQLSITGDFASGQAVADIAFSHLAANAGTSLSRLTIPLATAAAAA